MRTKRAQRRRKAPPKPEPQGLPDPFSTVWPVLVSLEAYREECCSCCEDRRYAIADALERELEQNWGGDDWDEWIRCLEDERVRPWDHFAEEARRTPESQPDFYEHDYDDWRRAFPDLQWESA